MCDLEQTMSVQSSTYLNFNDCNYLLFQYFMLRKKDSEINLKICQLSSICLSSKGLSTEI